MKLTTPIQFSPEKNQIDYASKVLLMGSCFTENIGAKLEYFKFQNLVNPFGILFHSVAIEKLIYRAINETLFTKDEVFFEAEQWHCFEVHSTFSNTSQEALLQQLNEQVSVLNKWIREASHIVLTSGTAWVYRHIETDAIVANCHKVPQKKFLKELLSVADVAASIENITVLIKSVNPNVVFIHTVSPVRHTKDGMQENSRSKAHLIAGVYEVVEPRKRNHYFPSYEIMIDELRDYRFYEQDMIHPNETAIALIWEQFQSVWIASETLALQKKITVIQKGLQHRPFNENSESHIKFKTDLTTKISEVKKELPWVYFKTSSL